MFSANLFIYLSIFTLSEGCCVALPAALPCSVSKCSLHLVFYSLSIPKSRPSGRLTVYCEPGLDVVWSQQTACQ